MLGTVGILNVGAGDTKISFDKNNAQDRIRAARIVTDMLRRGYALLVEVERDGVKTYERALAFKEDTCEYIIADFDGTGATAALARPEAESHAEPEAPAESTAKGGAARGRKSKVRRTVPADRTNAVAVAPSAGG